MNKLFEEFGSVDKKDWLSQIEKDLKGKSLSVLESQPEFDINIKAYHHIDDIANQTLIH